MLQLMFEGVGRLAWREAQSPVLMGGDALVRPITAARCDLDAAWMLRPLGRRLRLGIAAHLVDGAAMHSLCGAPPLAPSFAVGHECVADVIAVADDVSVTRVGQRVVVPFQIACGACEPCARGMTSRCARGPLAVTTYGFGVGAHLHGGALSDVLHVPYADAMLVPLPDGVDPVAAASASDNLPDALRSVGPALLERPHATVLVVGGAASSVGLYATAIAKALGASKVDYVDTSRERLEIAERLGARALEWPRASLRRRANVLPERYAISVDACSDLAGRGLELALRSLAPGGVCSVVGIYPRSRTPIPLAQMYVDGVTLRTGITNARALIPQVLALMADKWLDPAPVATLVAPWEEAHRAFLEPTTKVIVTRAGS
ncbi:MAG: Zn-dependent alcohol dehydrogenase [Myxococcaceae bacterium]|nr:Zn-dependent alcohol dehydrogenase [Myxococcaceae bacterium]